MKKLTKLFTTPACTCTARSKVIRSNHNHGFNVKNTRMQISSKIVF